MPSKFETKRRLQKVNDEIELLLRYLMQIPPGKFIDKNVIKEIATNINTDNTESNIQESEYGLEFLNELLKLFKLERRRRYLNKTFEINKLKGMHQNKKRKLETEAEEALQTEIKNPYNLRSTPPQSLQ
ncbi:uncharacterized protein LOC128552370 [Mercenaria mercenaria]|uniref:uncharacterized protein LOC128552370 n=1 Tax=Mercenaria mercenaria TaxID=6596 RepID=UPI00234F2368|nr:uncharacterized protein LOC128552370 [Mercenaria mercenaria]